MFGRASARRVGLAAAVAMAVTGVLAGAGVPGPVASATPDSPQSYLGVDGSATPTNFWLVSPGGPTWSFGDAPDLGSLPYVNQPIVGVTVTCDRGGYWDVAADGGVFAFGDAGFYGSMGATPLTMPVVGMAATPDGRGYWLVAADGGIFAFGDAGFYGSMGATPLNQPIVSMTATPDGRGYWLLAADGGVFALGDAAFSGSMGSAPTADPAEKLVPDPGGPGYWIFDQNGTAHAFGAASGTPPTVGLVFRPVTQGDRAVLFALAQLGKPYVYGGNGPAGYDCSGLALASWENGAGVGFARVADDQYETAGVPVALSALAAGDLVFWGTDTSDWTTVYHTAIYVGGDRIVEAAGTAVQLNSLDQWGAADQLMPNGRHP